MKLIKILRQNFNNVKVKNIKRDKLMPKRGTLSNSKAKRLIRYNPKWPIDKGYKRYIDWYKKQFQSFKK